MMTPDRPTADDAWDAYQALVDEARLSDADLWLDRRHTHARVMAFRQFEMARSRELQR